MADTQKVGKKNIALFMGILDNPYSDAVLEGAFMGARDCDVNLIVFPVDLIDAVYSDPEYNAYKYQYNILSSYMGNDSIDGLLVEYGTITCFIDEQRKKDFLAVAGDKPMVLLAEKAEGYCSVCMDNASGLVDIIEHLIVDHKYTKIGFLSGNRSNYDAQIRLDAYRTTMEKHGLECGEDWVVYGDFSNIVRTQVEELMGRHPDMEAIVCANDGMALGAIEVLKAMGKKPGEDIFITGFDNLPTGFLNDPALTTVKADPQELAYRAVVELCKPEFIKQEITIRTKMKKRKSCGCCQYDSLKDMQYLPGVSADWREMARNQINERDASHRLERELGHATRELVFTLKSNKERYAAFLAMMKRFSFYSSGLFLYDEFIEHKKGDKWVNPKTLNLVGLYTESDNYVDHIFEKGELLVPTEEIFNWGMVRDGDRHCITILPLFFGEIQIGFLAVESDYDKINYANDIAGQISNIIYTIYVNHAIEEANQSKSRFLANMSHEIRTPINAIIGFNEMVIRENKDENIAEYARDIKNAADTLLVLVNDSLDFSKIEAGKMELIVSEYKLDELFRGVINMMTEKAEKKGLALFLEYDENLPNVLEGDSGRIQQILINIISNAIKYTEKGKATLKVTGSVSGNMASLNFKVIDTGIGIKEEDITRLFARFERIEEKRNRNIEGTGLGINIVTGLLKLMDSKLQVKSVYGEGSEFEFTIKQRIVDPTPIRDSLEKTTKEKADDGIFAFTAPGTKILVVDDNFLNRKVIKSLLKDSKIEVDLAESGSECIDMVKISKYDLILLDHMMPVMDGIETLEIMVRDGLINTSETPVIALTANAIAGAREEYISKGFTGYLAKPVLPKVLFELLQQELVHG